MDTVTVNAGGTFDNFLGGNEGYRTKFIMNGGTVQSTGGGAINFSDEVETPGFTPQISTVSGSTSLFSAPITIRVNSLTVDVASASTLDISGAIGGGAKTLNKQGSGILILSGINTYSGGTNVNVGTLQLSGSGTIGNVANSTTLEILDGIHTVGSISGGGSTTIDAGATLTATSVSQNVLTLGAGATLNIAPIPGGPLASVGSLTAVPEPSTWAMLMLAAMGLGIYWRRGR